MHLIETATAWLEQDPDPITRSELKELIDSENLVELKARFETRLEFGTAGLRGELGAGPNRMNQIVVAQTALGIARFLKRNSKDYLDPNGELSVVIGYDGRTNSDVFARLSAEIFAANQVRTLLFDQMVPTPVAAFTGRRLRTSATIVVTASHNPPRDNGYKVYLGGENGNSQLVPPQDAQIANEIEQISSELRFDDIARGQNYSLIGDAEIDAYVERATELVPMGQVDKDRRSNLRIVHTAMHGVGDKAVQAIFKAVGFSLTVVAEQQKPDGLFPTVSFPNPEEPGAMDLSLELAEKVNADLVLANDPDADRLAVGIGKPIRMLTGDQVGMLLAEVAASSGAKVIGNSIVSQDLGPIARHYGINYQQTLTGFKWISKVAGLNYGYEEALGYCVDPEHTPDKDGITAALIIAELASTLAAKAQSIETLLAELSDRYGEVSTGQVSIRVSDLGIIDKVMMGLRSDPPRQILGETVQVEDFAAKSGNQKTNAMVLTGNNLKVIFRPSGTEPKLKCYLQFRGDSSVEGLERLKSWAQGEIKRLS